MVVDKLYSPGQWLLSLHLVDAQWKTGGGVLIR